MATQRSRSEAVDVISRHVYQRPCADASLLSPNGEAPIKNGMPTLFTRGRALTIRNTMAAA